MIEENKGKIIVRILAVLAIISGLGAFSIAIMLAAGSSFADRLGLVVLSDLEGLGMIAYVLYGAIFLALGGGLFALRSWARALALTLSWICVGVQALSFVLGLTGGVKFWLFSSLLDLLFSTRAVVVSIIVIVLFQFMPAIKGLFSKAMASAVAAPAAPLEPIAPLAPLPAVAVAEPIEIVMSETPASAKVAAKPAKKAKKKSAKKKVTKKAPAKKKAKKKK